MLLGIYEIDHEHWMMDGAPWDYGIELFAGRHRPDRKGADPGLRALSRRCRRSGVKTWVNGAFTFSPDGNPLVGPVPGKRGYWCACAVMAGFLQGGGVGKTLAEWMIHGEPEADVFGMDVARYGDYAENKRIHPRDHRPVLFPPLRDDLSERTTARRAAAENGPGL